MKAILQRRYGGVEVVELVERHIPEPAANQVQIKVMAAGVDRGTYHLLTGKPYLLRLFGFGLRAPKVQTPGRDVAGVVTALGSAVHGFKIGDEVFGVCQGSYAEYALGSERSLALKPETLSFQQAAALPASSVTALRAIREVAKLEAGQRVLILGASGGVGSFAVQLAHSLGARVTGVSGPGGLELIRSLGAERALDYTLDGLEAEKDFDAILDIAGGRPLNQLRRMLSRKGVLVVIGTEQGGPWTGGVGRSLRANLLSPWVSQRLSALVSFEDAEALVAVRELVDAGAITPAIERSYPLDQAAQAIRHVGEGHTLGKVVITVA
ncbi:NAD(P)-dependent alcohol dehydrogenase [Psychromicrobium lacuslunae]|uniref:NADPH:quinone reductase n=1 Tax=Psychromicrobium lacuslunae TaxID=1618207 RepID=A0A0D4BZE8_9MICC|nr:NAD(P)-dependent alcohol dehydrogenase [Psychromicrobium lacuslunae]AJT41822.1 NADPH:quinone reductase [Psychromicrobium lacuslunae]